MRSGKIGKVLAVVLAFGLFAAACTDEKQPRSYVQANVIDKGFFQGEWWYSTKVIDMNYPFEGMTYPGDAAYDISSAGYAVARIRWVIDESYLYAFRAFELVEGANSDAYTRDPETGAPVPVDEYIGEPVAAYKIKSHFDIRRQYNPTTGEEYNILEENTYDRKWFERQYMRVDWSQNLLVSWMVNGAELYSDAGILNKESVPMFVQEESQWEDYYPTSWKPKFAFADQDFDAKHGTHFADDPATDLKEGDYRPNELFFMSFVNQAIFTPGNVDDPYTGEMVPWCMSVYVDAPICTSNLVTSRSSFTKISPTHEFKPNYYPDHTHFDHFGVFRIERWQYDQIMTDDPGGDWHLGETDFLGYYASMFNIWNEIFNEDGSEIPYEDRNIKQIVYHISSETPRWLFRPALQFMIEWNDVFMGGVRVRKGQAMPDRNYLDTRDWFEAPDPGKRDINCWIAAVTSGGGHEFLEDPLALNADGTPRRTITSWNDFSQENRLAMFYDPDYSFDGVRPGSECLVALHVNTCDKPLEAFDDEDRQAIQATMDESGIGSIDDLTDDQLYAAGIECEERGDMRYKLISYISQPGAPFLGVTSIQSDPVTGEIVSGDANIAAWDLHRYRVRATDEVDLVSGDTSELEFMTGEDIRGYYEKLGYSLPPPAIIVPAFLQGQIHGANGVTREGIHYNMDRVMAKAGKLKGTEGLANLMTHRRQALVGSDIEKRLLDNDESAILSGIVAPRDDGAPIPLDSVIDSISPFKFTAMDVYKKDMETFQKFSRSNVTMPNFFIDFSVQNFINEHQDWPRQNQIFKIEQVMYKETLIHEFGHTINLRHNMRGTADPWNYPEPYFDIVANNPKPEALDFDTDADGYLNAMESNAYREALDTVAMNRELNTDADTKKWGSVDTWMTASMMDYTGQWYNRMLHDGHYIESWDKAGTVFAYNDLVEVFLNDNNLLAKCKDPSSGLNDGCVTPDKLAKGEVGIVYWTYYGGGEVCDGDNDCPHASGGERSWELMDGQIKQTCNSGMCSNFYDDMLEEYPGDRPDKFARRYKFCTDDRRTDIGMDDSQCNIFDEGASYREIVSNMRKTYHRKYIFNNFRRFGGRYDFYPYYSAIVGRFFLQPVKIFQDMIFRYSTQPEYRTDDGPFGFYDQYMASVDLLNFWAEVMSYPNVGAFKKVEYKNVWDQFQEDTDNCLVGSNNCIRVDLGTGKYMYSRYQRGMNGVQRVEHFGTFYDKMYALQMLLVRGLAFTYSWDEMFYINFYDVFPQEITTMLKGMISNDSHLWKARVVDFDEETWNPILQYPSLYRGNCLPEEMIPDPADPEVYSCMPDPMEVYEGWDTLPTLEDYGSFYLRLYGLIYALEELPVYFDTAPQEMVHVYKVGSLFDADIPTCICDPDCDLECACDLTEDTCDLVDPDDVDSGNCECDLDCYTECACNTNLSCEHAVEGKDYVTFTSDKTHQTFMAFQVGDMPTKQGGSIAFDVILKSKQLQDNLQKWRVCLENGTLCDFADSGDLSDAYYDALYEVDSFEGMLNYAIELQQMFGISSWMGY
ncbi:MAG: hypothetical protein ABIJ56_02095 [Pseudomonadota bacterium]